MNKQTFIRAMAAIVVILAATLNAHAQLEFFNEKNQKIGMIFPDGKITNAQNQVIGYINADGKVTNAQNQQLGSIASNGTISDANARPILKTSLGRTATGKTTTPQNADVFQIMPDGKVTNAKNQQIATVKGEITGKTSWRTEAAVTPSDIKNLWSSVFFIFFDKTTIEKTTFKTSW